MNPDDLVRRVILTEMVTLYRAPSQVQNAEQGAVYQTAIIETLAQFNPTEPELSRMWEKFKRSWTKTIWPTPGELCQALTSQRTRHEDPRPRALDSYGEPLMPIEQAEFDECVAGLHANPEQYFAADRLLRMAEHFEKRDR